MASDYQIVLRDPFGNALRIVDNFTEFDLSRVVGAQGYLTLVLPDRYDITLNLYDFDVFNRPDATLEVWRSVNGGLPYLEGETIWFVVDAKRTLGSGGEKMFTVVAADPLEILRRRYILYAAGTAQAEKTAALDNMLKAFVSDNMGATATDTTRNLSAYIRIQANLTQVFSDTKGASWRNLLTVLQEIDNASAAASATTPTYLAFDIVYVSTGLLEFRTYTRWRGTDHRISTGAQPVIVDPNMGTLSDVSLDYDYRKERNAITAGGLGVGTARVIETANDAARIALSPFHRIEYFLQAAGATSTAAAVTNDANQALRDSRFKIAFNGRLIQSPGALYGVHYRFGDVITAQYTNTAVNCRVDGIHITVRNGLETVDALLRTDDLI